MSTDILNFVDGEYIKNASGKTFEKRTPIDNSPVGTVYEAGKPEVDAAVAAARAALDGEWGALPVNTPNLVLRTMKPKKAWFCPVTAET